MGAGSGQRAIEQAFQRRREAWRAGAVGDEAYLAAERAYHVLADPAARIRHDRQLGLVAHPAWRSGSPVRARRLVRRALSALAAGRPAPAEHLLRAALAMAGKPPEAGGWLAAALVRGGGCRREALRLAAEAVAASPADGALRFVLAEVLEAVGAPDAAVRARRRGWRLILRSVLRQGFGRADDERCTACGL